MKVKLDEKSNFKSSRRYQSRSNNAFKKNQSLKRIDPILEELYAVKAAINKEANYSVKEILKRAYPSVVS
jgi:hypothetical protein